MATPIGTNVVNSISRRYIMPQLVDTYYRSNVITFRLLSRNKKMVQGGYQIEIPLVYTGFAAGGWYQGFDQLDISPSDTIKNAAFDWKQLYVPVTVDRLTLIKTDSPEAVVNFLTFYFEQAQAQLVDLLGTGVWSDAVTNAKMLDGLRGAVDDGTVAATYGGLLRSANTWFRAQVDSATAALTLASLQTLFGNTTEGGRHPTIIASTQANYNRYWALSVVGQAFPVQPSGADEQLAANGFTNLLFNGVPWVVDSKITANHIYFLNEDYIYLVVNPQADVAMDPFREPVDQDAMTALIRWAGNLCVSNPARQGKMTAVTS